MMADYLRMLARTCLARLLRLGKATRLRSMADELLAKADEIEANQIDAMGVEFRHPARP
jgi:hypothetical protein